VSVCGEPAQGLTAPSSKIGDDVRAESATAIWRDLDSALSPVIGRAGVAALYRRSLQVSSARYPCLASAQAVGLWPGDLLVLSTVLSQQTGVGAASANGALLQCFSTLLAELIGPVLTERLIGFAHSPSRSGHAAQDTPS
jgi:hypothetical protein